MARTTDEIVDRLRGWLPPDYVTAEPLLGGLAAPMRVAEEQIDTLSPLVTIGGGTGEWLTLQARGYGVYRVTGETDASLRARLRNIEDCLTRPSILDAVNAVLVAHGRPPSARMVEWFDEPYLDLNDAVTPGAGGFYQNSVHLGLGRRSFLILVKLMPLAEDDPIFTALFAEIQRLRAAGIVWRLVIVD